MYRCDPVASGRVADGDGWVEKSVTCTYGMATGVRYVHACALHCVHTRPHPSHALSPPGSRSSGGGYRATGRTAGGGRRGDEALRTSTRCSSPQCGRTASMHHLGRNLLVANTTPASLRWCVCALSELGTPFTHLSTPTLISLQVRFTCTLPVWSPPRSQLDKVGVSTRY